MTCIVGLVEGGVVYMGGDSAGIEGYALAVRKDPKVFKKGPAVIGYTSSFRMGQLLRYKLDLPDGHTGDLFEWMCSTFVDQVRDVLAEGGYAKKENNVEHGGRFLVGLHGRLFMVDSDYEVSERAHTFDAVGCGADVALGSLFTSSSAVGVPAHRVRRALCAAEEFSAGVRHPFTILNTVEG